jgi:hypothetical protein
VHGEQRGLPHTAIEIRHDLIENEQDQRFWAQRMCRILVEAKRLRDESYGVRLIVLVIPGAGQRPEPGIHIHIGWLWIPGSLTFALLRFAPRNDERREPPHGHCAHHIGTQSAGRTSMR